MKRYKITTTWKQEFYEYGTDSEDAIYNFLINMIAIYEKDILSCVEEKKEMMFDFEYEEFGTSYENGVAITFKDFEATDRDGAYDFARSYLEKHGFDVENGEIVVKEQNQK
jgi:hypothetical protein